MAVLIPPVAGAFFLRLRGLTGQQRGAGQRDHRGRHDKAAHHGQGDEPSAADLLVEDEDTPQDRHNRIR